MKAMLIPFMSKTKRTTKAMSIPLKREKESTTKEMLIPLDIEKAPNGNPINYLECHSQQPDQQQEKCFTMKTSSVAEERNENNGTPTCAQGSECSLDHTKLRFIQQTS